jgi:rubrerythrin
MNLNLGLMERERISLALKTALQNEQALAAKYADLAKSITEPTIQKHLQSLEQTARNHLNLITEQMERLCILQ